jgi:hypothetical protein
MCASRCFVDLFHRSVEVAVVNVVADGVVEQRCILRHNTNRASQAVERDVANVLPVDKDAAFLGVVKAEEEAEDRGLAAAAGADDGDFFAGGDGQVKILDDGSVRTVAEGYILEYDFAFVEFQGRSIGLVLDLDIDLLEVEEGFHVK